MNQFVIKKPNGLLVVSLIQLLLLFFYFTLNITNVGEMGTALPLLGGFVALAGGVFFLQLVSMVWIYWTHLECDHVNIYHYQTAGL